MWLPDKTTPLPTLEWLLTLADHAHNLTGSRGFGTFAVGAVGKDARKVRLVLGVNSSPKFDPNKILAEKSVPPVVRNAIEMSNVVMTKEPYHAEVSCVLWAKDNSMKLFAVASSRVVCETCAPMLERLAPDALVADTWESPGGVELTHEQRKSVNLGSAWTGGINNTGYRAAYSRAS